MKQQRHYTNLVSWLIERDAESPVLPLISNPGWSHYGDTGMEPLGDTGMELLGDTRMDPFGDTQMDPLGDTGMES